MNYFFKLFTTASCAVCGRPNSKYLCPSCMSGLELIKQSEPLCKRCGVELISSREYCMRCLSWSTPCYFEQNTALAYYCRSFKRIIYNYKFEQELAIAKWLAKELSKLYFAKFKGLPIVPAPPRKHKILYSGWDQIQYLARILNKQYNINVRSVLYRSDNLQQKQLKLSERQSNLNLQLRPKSKLDFKACVVLDDIFTTGSTVNNCARVLKESGVERVSSLCLAVV